MIHPRIFRQSLVTVIAGQLVLTLIAYLFPSLSGYVLFGLRLVMAAAGGYAYGEDYEGGYSPSAVCGMQIGGAAVLPSLALSVLLGMDPGSMVPVTLGAAVLTGGIGGALGAWAADLYMQEYRER